VNRYLATRTLPRAVKGWTGELLALAALCGGLIAMAAGL
jgi:hypothetical protein